MNNRVVLAVTGSDREAFLQGLITNDVERAIGGIVYAALLTAQGKLIADFFVVGEDDRFLIDVAASVAPTLFQRLNMYRLRADVAISETDLIVSRGTGSAPTGALPDPRHPEMGWRHYGTQDVSQPTDWNQLRVNHLVPETGVELTPDTYILEAGFERLHGVDFRKGCYVGQEIVARMKHKTTLRKGLVQVKLDGPASVGSEISVSDKVIGTLHRVSGDTGVAYLRLDRASGDMRAGNARLTLIEN